MSASDFYTEVITGYLTIIQASLPVALFIAGCNVGFNILISAFCGGRLRFGRGGE